MYHTSWCTARKHHAAHPKALHLNAYNQLKWLISHRRLTSQRMCKSCVTYLLTHLLTYQFINIDIRFIFGILRVPHLEFRIFNEVKYFNFLRNSNNNILLVKTLPLAPLSRYFTSKALVHDIDSSGSPKVKYFNFFLKPMFNFLIVVVFCW